MYNVKLCVDVVGKFGLSLEDEIDLVFKTGFEGVFTAFTPEIVKKTRRLADQRGLIYQSVHAPFYKVHKMWTKDDYKEPMDEMINCLESCSDNGVDLMVAHTFIGFDDHNPCEYGIENFEKVARRAKELGVKMALENTEGEEYLAALMKGLSHMDNVGFCYDTGHEQCYNYGKNLISMYGDRLFGTHINDNAGIRDYNGKITCRDDLHLLPYDGIIDWNCITKRIADCGFEGPLTFELKIDSIECRHENDMYAKMSPEEFYALAYVRACKVARAYRDAKSGANN